MNENNNDSVGSGNNDDNSFGSNPPESKGSGSENCGTPKEVNPQQ